MLKPVTNVLHRQPLSPKPTWDRAELFVEPAGIIPAQYDTDDQDDEGEAAHL